MTGAAVLAPERDRRTLGLMAAGHLCADLAQGSVPALVPFLVTGRDGIGYGRAGVLLLVMALTSSVVQPVIGAWADRHRAAWAVPGGVALAGLGIAGLGVAGDYATMLAAVAVAGLGVAVFHPDGARRATVAAGPRPAGGLGLFAVGGSAGFALAPALLTPVVVAWGLPGTAVVLLPALSVALLLAVAAPPVPEAATPGTSADGAGTARDHPRAFAFVVGVASMRAGAYFGAQTLLAVAIAARLDLSELTANVLLTVMLAAGAGGTLGGGLLADRLGNRATIGLSLLASAPALVLVQLAPTLPAAIVASALLGLAVTAAYSPTIVLGQRLMPGRQRLAAGMTVGLAIGAGGVAASGLGVLADATGPASALWAVAGFGLAGALLSRRLPAG